MKKCRQKDNFGELSLTLRLTAEWMARCGLRVAEFTERHLMPSLSEHQLLDDAPSQADAWEAQKERYTKRVTRILSGESPLPYEWRESWLNALPGSVSEQIIKIGARDRGFMLIRSPLPSGPGCVDASLDVLATSFADVMQAAAPAFDGTYGPEDSLLALRALERRLAELREATTSEMNKVMSGISAHPENV